MTRSPREYSTDIAPFILNGAIMPELSFFLSKDHLSSVPILNLKSKDIFVNVYVNTLYSYSV